MNHLFYRLEIQILNFGIWESFIFTYSFTALVLKRQNTLYAVEPLFVPIRETWNGARASLLLIGCHLMILMISIAMLWATKMKKVSVASKSRKSPKEMGAYSIAWIGKMKTHLRRLRPKNGRATNHVMIRKKEDVLGNDLKNALMQIVSVFITKLIALNTYTMNCQWCPMERHLKKTTRWVYWGLRGLWKTPQVPLGYLSNGSLPGTSFTLHSAHTFTSIPNPTYLAELPIKLSCDDNGEEKGDVLGNDLKSALMHIVSFSITKLIIFKRYTINRQWCPMERHLEKTMKWVYWGLRGLGKTPQTPLNPLGCLSKRFFPGTSLTVNTSILNPTYV